MKYQIEISDQADADLRGIFEYIAVSLRSVQNASGQLDRLEQAILSLETMPERYRAYAREPWHGRGLRVMPVDNYLVFYIPDEETRAVRIIRVMYGGRNADEQLNKHTTL